MDESAGDEIAETDMSAEDFGEDGEAASTDGADAAPIDLSDDDSGSRNKRPPPE